MFSAESLLASNERLDQLVCSLLQFIDADDLDDFLARRSDFGTDLNRHLMEELRSVGLTLMAGNDAATKAKVQALFDRIEDINQQWLQYLIEWPEDMIAIEDQLFLSDSRAILTMMRTQIKQSSNLLFPLALQKGAIRLRSGEQTSSSPDDYIQSGSLRRI